MIKISDTEIPIDLFINYCNAIGNMQIIRDTQSMKDKARCYTVADKRRRCLHDRIMTFVKDDNRFSIKLAEEVEKMIKGG